MQSNVDAERLLEGICRAIHERRIELKITQEELAMRCGLHRTYISDIERVRRNISLRNFQRLTEALEIAPSMILDRVESRATAEKV